MNKRYLTRATFFYMGCGLTLVFLPLYVVALVFMVLGLFMIKIGVSAAAKPMVWRTWAHDNQIAIDQAVNALLRGDPQETISSRAGKLTRWAGMLKSSGREINMKMRAACVLCRILDKFDRGHCEKAIVWSEGRSERDLKQNYPPLIK